MRNIRTDLAAEARGAAPEAHGIRQEVNEYEAVTVTRIYVETEAAAKALGKPLGEYVTLDAPGLGARDASVYAGVADELAKVLRAMLERKGVPERAAVMIVGLGNRAITADSLGPKVVEKALVTRHLREFLPDDAGELRPVCAFAPGVLGITGVETGEMVRGVMERVKAGAVVAIDALASRSTERIGATLQLSDSGIHPGSGLGNRLMGLNEATLGVPVIALGVPLVVHASTLARDALALMLRQAGGADSLEDEESMLALVDDLVCEKLGPLVVTPRDIDAIVADCSSIVARGVNLALHGCNLSEIESVLSKDPL